MVPGTAADNRTCVVHSGVHSSSIVWAIDQWKLPGKLEKYVFKDITRIKRARDVIMYGLYLHRWTQRPLYYTKKRVWKLFINENYLRHNTIPCLGIHIGAKPRIHASIHLTPGLYLRIYTSGYLSWCAVLTCCSLWTRDTIYGLPVCEQLIKMMVWRWERNNIKIKKVSLYTNSSHNHISLYEQLKSESK